LPNDPLIPPTPLAIHLTQIQPPIPILQFIHQQPEHIIRLPYHIGLHQFGLLLPPSAIIPFICALILIFRSTSSMLPHLLSPGQRQRLAVASILSMEPDIIVLDELTTGQDRGHLNKFLSLMKMLNEAGKTIIRISHDMGVVAEYASRTIVMKDGGILMDAGTREVIFGSLQRVRTVRRLGFCEYLCCFWSTTPQ